MPYTTINSGDYIESSWANANVRDQVVTPFSSTATRNSTITSPLPGMLSTLTTNTVTEGLYEYTSAGTWRLPWNLPWGYVAISALPASFSFNSTLSFSSTFTFAAINNRNYLVSFGGEFNNGATVLNIVDTATIHTSASTAGAPVPVSYAGVRTSIFNANSQETRSTSFVFTSTSTATQSGTPPRAATARAGHCPAPALRLWRRGGSACAGHPAIPRPATLQ
jgi:hypothetical protein